MTAGDARRYRRLMWAYPGPYRRRHGVEIVTTLLEMAESGDGRPARAQMLHLVLCGIRQRFRLPARRPFAVLAAVLTAIAVGALGTAGGTWLGWRTATPLPSDGDLRALAAAAAGTDPSRVAAYPSQTAMKGPSTALRTTVATPYSAERLRAALTSDGWRITRFAEETGAVTAGTADDPFGAWTPLKRIGFAAEKDGLSLEGDSWTTIGGDDDQTDARVGLWAVEPAAVRPLTIAGLLAGLLTGWLITAALADRIRHGRLATRRMVALLGATALAAAAGPAVALYDGMYQVLSYDSGAGAYIVDSLSSRLPAGLVPTGIGVGLLVLVAAAAITHLRVAAGRSC
ncbi:hypothetical protein AB0J80_12710 [Actinoplanes sp. NPDC049548]|uniref:hypothetical protein n=1 Tax=Actinoplanes sp. NPDC049548 TaxID=3155152 RepID=UPI00341EE6B3